VKLLFMRIDNRGKKVKNEDRHKFFYHRRYVKYYALRNWIDAQV